MSNEEEQISHPEEQPIIQVGTYSITESQLFAHPLGFVHYWNTLTMFKMDALYNLERGAGDGELIAQELQQLEEAKDVMRSLIPDVEEQVELFNRQTEDAKREAKAERENLRNRPY